MTFPSFGKRPARIAAVVVAAALLALGIRVAHSDDRTDIVAYFSNTDGIYAGDEVRILGVPVGRVDAIEPDGSRMRVQLHFDGDVAVPADAEAVIVAPSLVSSRYIQLAPRYDGGAEMADGDTIPLERTSTPVEWDEVKGQLYELSEALGPKGANKDGAMSALIGSLAEALDGQGATVNRTISDLAAATSVLDRGADDAFSTVRNLQVFVGAMAASDAQLARFIEQLDGVSDMFADDRRLLRAALRDLSTSVGVVSKFIEDNGGLTVRTVERLGRTLHTVAAQQRSLAQILHAGPTALENLSHIYRENQNAVSVNLAATNLKSPGQLICGALGGAAGTSGKATEELCSELVGDLLDDVANRPEAQALLQSLLLLLSGGTP